ncbi:T-complex 11 protein [Raphanus sativus]|nr:T-complex 11 protein [Raphanus sativus]
MAGFVQVNLLSVMGLHLDFLWLRPTQLRKTVLYPRLLKSRQITQISHIYISWISPLPLKSVYHFLLPTEQESQDQDPCVAAEKKRLGLLEAEKKARARVQKVRHVDNSVSNQREMERSKMRDKLEDKLHSAKRHRSEFLHQRRRQRDSISIYCDMMQQDDDHLYRKLSSVGGAL